MKVKTYLPVFPGFYNTIFDFDYTDLPNNYDINYTKYCKDVAIQACDFISIELSEFITTVEFEKNYSPKSYNYTNDVIYCKIDLKENEIIKFINSRKTEFEIYLKDNFTSYNGFSSYYSNKLKDWNINKALKHETQSGAILEFICTQLLITSLDMFYSLELNCQDYILN